MNAADEAGTAPGARQPVVAPGGLCPEFAPLPADATPEAKDRHWYETTYQGDRVPQLTVRAVLTGAVIGMLMSVGNLYTVMKVGLGFGVAITSCVLSYLTWSALRTVSGGRVGQLSVLENNCMQTTASAAGFSASASLSVTFAALLMLDPEHRHQPWWVVAAFTFTTATLGVFLAIPMKRLFINQEQLPFPTGTAAAATLRGLYGRSRGSLRQAAALLAGLGAGALSAILSTAEDQFAALGRFFEWMRMHLVDVHLPEQIPEHGFGLIGGKPAVGFGLEPGVVMLGFGMIIGLRVSLSMLLASAALYFGIAPWLQGIDASHAATPGYVASIPFVAGGALAHPLRWALWGGAAVLICSSLTSLALHWKTVARSFAGLRTSAGRRPQSEIEARMAAIEVPGSWMIVGMIPIAIAMVAVQILAFGVSWWAGAIAVALSFVLALVVARATGETDIAPTGALGKLMQLAFAVLSPPGTVGIQASVAHNVMSAGIADSSATASAELLSDLKTGYLLGANPRKQFLAQMIGVTCGTLVCVPAWFLLVPNVAALERYPVPAAQIWVAMAHALTSGLANLPPTIVYAVLIGSALGVLLPVLERLLPRARQYLPSATGLGLGWVVPFSVPLSFAIGATLAAIWGRLHASSHEHYRLPIASGLIAGESMVKAMLAILATAISLAA
jgi:uncharacterized oligopeptide transporter (OPT) family protein